MLRESRESQKDTRETSDGEPLRLSWDLPSISMPMHALTSTDEPYRVYEAQISVVVTGFDHYVWAAYGLVDTYFDLEETVEGYHQLIGAGGSTKGRPDPLAAGRINADEPIWTPREYFFKILELRMDQVHREWNFTARKVERNISRYV